MAELTERERILRTYRRQEIDRIPMLDLPWKGTLRRWKQEGLPEDMAWEDHFGFDMQEFWAFNMVADIDYVPEIIAETETTITIISTN